MSSLSTSCSFGRRARRALFAVCLGASALPASALNIVLTNDDGFETNNIQALFTALKAAGHDVILSAPYRNQSGTSGQVAFLTPITPTTRTSEGGKLPIGSFGTGPTTIAADQFYVDGSPVAAVLYGIDVQAKTKWGKAPDLVISGPNVGNNLGFVTSHSGTIGAAITAINKGIPALAVSAANDDAATAALVGQITLRVLASALTQGRVNLPVGTGLNVNVPRLDAKKTAADYRYAFTQIGTGADFGLQFFQRLGDSPIAVGFGIPAGTPLPGVALAIPYTSAGYATDRSPTSEATVLAAGTNVTVSPIQGTYQASADKAATILNQMKGLFPDSTFPTSLKLTNLSSRAVVGTGGDVQIMGFVVDGTAPKTVLLRAAGPALAPFGIGNLLGDPVLELYDSRQVMIGSNDNWGDDSAKATAIEAVVSRIGALPWTRTGRDAAVLVTLEPGLYTVIVKGAGGASGVALIEIFDAIAN